MGDVGMPKLDRVNVRRAIKDAFLDGLETACKGIKPLDWTVGKYGMWANTFDWYVRYPSTFERWI